MTRNLKIRTALPQKSSIKAKTFFKKSKKGLLFPLYYAKMVKTKNLSPEVSLMITVGTQSAHWFSWKDPDTSMKNLKSYGFNAVDFGMPGVPVTPDPPTSFYDKPLDELLALVRPIKEAADKHGIIFSQCHAPFPLWVKDREDFNSYMVMVMEKICAMAHEMGCPAIVAHPVTRSSKEKEYETNFEMYRTFMPAAKKYGVKLCLENMFSGSGGRISEGSCADADETCFYIDKLNEEAGADLFGYCFDIGHANLMHRNMRRFINKLGKRLTCLHIHDNDGADDLHLCPYTQVRLRGKCNWSTDWEGVIEGLRDIG
jgi:sugar phosphate isomerase/epimerase